MIGAARAGRMVSALGVAAVVLAPMRPGVTTTIFPQPPTTVPATTTSVEPPTTGASTTTSAPVTAVPTQPPRRSTATAGPRTTLPPLTTTMYLIPGVSAPAPTPSTSVSDPTPQNADLPGWTAIAFLGGIGGMIVMLLGRRLMSAAEGRRRDQ